MTFFFPSGTLEAYDNMICQDTNRDKLVAIHIAQQHVWTFMLTYKIKVSVLECLTLGNIILREQDVEWSNPTSRAISQERRLQYKREGKTDSKLAVTLHIAFDWLTVQKKIFQTKWDQKDCNV